ncbi:MAG: type II toxin-antitoxin system VapC family toxin [Desulfamplus sp.]|nr:type II toxin-antitoxin system VapC family toxin [Desulfamplus sp.]MBF0390598.1 type II toxin-antitoxin system VapC family toxin [Desulfamplus sp.]
MKYLIDTNICIYIMNKRPVSVINRFKAVELGDIGVSSITVSELQYGVSKSKFIKKNKERLEEFLIPFEILPYDNKAAEVYGDIRYRLEQLGQPVGPMDLLIAAHAISKCLILVTNNEKEFIRIENLKIENWAK